MKHGIRVIHDGAINFAYWSSYGSKYAQGDQNAHGLWLLYLERKPDDYFYVRDLTHDEARRFGQAFCATTAIIPDCREQ